MAFKPRKLILLFLFILVAGAAIYIIDKYYGDYILRGDLVKIRKFLYFWRDTGKEIKEDLTKEREQVDKKKTILQEMKMDYEEKDKSK
ncbi:MAG: hypothetical protein AB1765_03320 [Candidatus Hydrogenedentota bacterium]